MSQTQILMSSPEYFKVEYSINPWMVSGTQIDLELAKHQWENLKSTIENAGAEVKVVPPNENYPDLVFTANSGIINKNDVLIANFRFEERRGEEELYSNWFKDNGYNVSRIPSEFKFEGRGDAFVYGDYLVGSYGIRSDKDALLYIADAFELEPVIVELAQEKFYHLDTCFQNLPSGDAIFYPDAFVDKSLSSFQSLFNLIPVTEHDANKLACNAVVVNNTIIFPSEDIEAISTIEKLGLQAEVADVSEFLKSGGACQCLVIALN